MAHVPVLIAGGGPVGMTLARTLALYGVRCLLVERNATTTRHPKMDITNGRSMELFRRIGVADKLRAVAVPEENNFDISWITSLAKEAGGRELHRFRYPSVTQKRAEIRARNDGTQPREPAMRVSQVMIEPVLRDAILDHPLVDARWGVAFEDFEQDETGVTVTLRTQETGATEQVRCDFLAGCDGGTSAVREKLGIALEGRAAVAHRFMVHFRSEARDLLQRFGIAWHYQKATGTIIAQDDKEIWTLQTRLPPGSDPVSIDPHKLLDDFAGKTFPREILVANPWFTHLLLAERYGAGRVFLAGDAAHQYIPTGGYGMNTGIGDAIDLGFKLAATVKGFATPGLLESYERERRPVGYRNRIASERHTGVRLKIAELYQNERDPEALGRAIAAAGNAENESWGIEFGYRYDGVEGDPVVYEPTTAPGARLPSTFLSDGSALYDRLGPWFTLLHFGVADPSSLIDAAPAPLDVVYLDEPALASIYETRLVLVRPDTHVAWRGNGCDDGAAVWAKVLDGEARMKVAVKVAVIGGGIGGLSAALALLNAGFDVQVYEQAQKFGEIGAGIQISPNASRLLHRLGLKPAMDKWGVLPLAIHQKRWDDGRTLQRAPLGPEVEALFGAPYYHFHRGDLAALLADAMPKDRLHAGHRLVSIEEKGERVVARFENGVSTEVDLLIGADGIHSNVRALTFGPEKPRFTGCVAWRGLVPAERIAHLNIELASHNWQGPDAHCVHYWVSAQKLMNVVCVVEHGTWTSESWTDKGNVADVLARYEGWHPTVRGLISAFPETFIWALHDRAPLPAWTQGRIALLGDACHPMLPMMAQGAAQAIEDGATLTSLLKAMPDDVPSALRRYEAVRKPRATRLQEISAANRKRFHLPDGPEQQKRDEATANSGDRSMANIGWLYMHDAALVS